MADPRTTPVWYGLWIESPLRRPQCEVLLALLEGTDDPDESRDDDLRQFLAALLAAVAWELPLHVEMHPPGHTDLGWHTIFPHCPRPKCKISMTPNGITLKAWDSTLELGPGGRVKGRTVTINDPAWR